MAKYKRDDLKTLLLESECIVEFTKVNGEKRTMPCTLNPELMPPPPDTSNDEEAVPKKKEPNLTTLGVWCTDKKAWRSFRVDNVTDIKVKD